MKSDSDVCYLIPPFQSKFRADGNKTDETLGDRVEWSKQTTL